MNEEHWKKLKENYYRSNAVCQTDDGTIDFSLDNFKQLETNGSRITYDEYLDIMRASGNSTRHYFEMCFYSGGAVADCKGEIQNFDWEKHKVIFKRIFVSGMYSDDDCFEGKEDHVWMDDAGFEEFNLGDSVSFSAEVYRYLKTRNRKQIDFGLRNPEFIKKTGDYKLPTDDALIMQSIDSIICEACMYSEHCYGFCLAESWWEEMRKAMFAAYKNEAQSQ